MKKILITGCSTGFGFAASQYLAGKGHEVYASMRNTSGKNAAAAEALRNFDAGGTGSIQVLDVDVTSDESVENAVAGLPAMDVLINNAGLGYGGAIEAFTSKQCLDQLDVNIVGTLRMSKAVLPGMRKQNSGLIIQVSSIAGRGAFPGFGVYHASKWGLEGLSESMRYELAPLGIDVVMVEPGPFETNFFGNVETPTDVEIASAYQHVNGFLEGFEQNVKGAFEDANAPTDPGVVSEIFERLIETPAGERPLRTIAGLDFGFQQLNDAVEPFRKASLASMGLEEMDGPQKQTAGA
jgi:NAD(P)-dependent dehydrogenase (short-subunit alcohol dehydrogenase family)